MEASLSASISAAVTGFSASGPGEGKSSIGEQTTTSSRQQVDTALSDLHVDFQPTTASPASQHTVAHGALGGSVAPHSQGQPSVQASVQLIPIHADVLNRWRHLGATKGLASDSQIANYLLQYYDNTLNSLSSSPRCANCHSALPLPLYCSKCSQPSEGLNPTSVSFPASENSSLASDIMTTVSASMPCFPTNPIQGSFQFNPVMDMHNASLVMHGEDPALDRKDFTLGAGGKKLRPVNLKKKKKGKKFKGKRGDYTCKECGTHITPTPRQRRRAGFKPYKCAECGATFAYRRMLETHLFQKQDGAEGPSQSHKCMHCGLVVLNSCDMRNHTLKHTAEMPYKCPHCPLAFSLACNLKTHLRTHTGERPFSCSVCGRAFSQSIALKVHMRKHTGEKPFQCELCEMAFAASSNLSRHMLKHTGEKPYKCQYCVAAFSQPGSLKTHTRKHTGERPYKCEACGAAFSDHSTLWKHKRKNSCAFNTNHSARMKKTADPQQPGLQPPPQPPSQPQPAMQGQPTAMPMAVGTMVTTSQGHQQVYRPQPVEEAPYISGVGWCFPMQQQ